MAKALVANLTDPLLLVAALLLTSWFASHTMAPAFASTRNVQHDARQHLFWMQRFRDPDLFSGDLVANYFQALAPPAFSGLYWVLSWWTDPLGAAKFVSLGLGLVSVGLTYGLTRRLHPAPLCALLASVLLGWCLWQHDDLPSATPRAFLMPALAGLLWSLAAGRSSLAVLVLVVGALFYPITGLLGWVLLAIHLTLRHSAPNWRNRLVHTGGLLLAAGLGVIAAVLPNQLALAQFGPVISHDQALASADFGPKGHNSYFGSNPLDFWLFDSESGVDLSVADGLFPGLPLLAKYLPFALLLPLLARTMPRDSRLPRPRRSARVLVELLIASIGLFFLAHALFVQLYFPARYLKWSLQLTLSVAAGLALGMLLTWLAGWIWPRRTAWASGALCAGLVVLILAYPARFSGRFRTDLHPAITAYLRDQPKQTLIAGVAFETDSLPYLSGRSVLSSYVHVLPFHQAYSAEMARRLDAQIEAYYAPSVREVVAFADRFGVDLILVDRQAFQPTKAARAWTGLDGRAWEPYLSRVAVLARTDAPHALLDLADRCAAIDDGVVAVVTRRCLEAGRL